MERDKYISKAAGKHPNELSVDSIRKPATPSEGARFTLPRRTLHATRDISNTQSKHHEPRAVLRRKTWFRGIRLRVAGAKLALTPGHSKQRLQRKNNMLGPHVRTIDSNRP
uniref:Uncharacterized protein n=1 Tax=Coccidioides posadasii RMSCC 3488 TaxID=454284 RepID=A0A0J6FGN9_COCPO|nr:hypothetical protein CPAG_04391 [Coccidioides posadasii RMSCC 3488]